MPLETLCKYTTLHFWKSCLCFMKKYIIKTIQAYQTLSGDSNRTMMPLMRSFIFWCRRSTLQLLDWKCNSNSSRRARKKRRRIRVKFSDRNCRILQNQDLLSTSSSVQAEIKVAFKVGHCSVLRQTTSYTNRHLVSTTLLYLDS